MIAFIKWKVIDLTFNSITILTESWLWYEIWINELTYSKLSLETEISLYLYHHITENNQSLFWFIEKEEKTIFSELIKISWVWGKVAMQILSLWVNRLIMAIQWEDNKTIEQVKWIWKKMAEKIVLELKDKDFGIKLKDSENTKNKLRISLDLHFSIKSTLTNMWYMPQDIDRILSNLPEDKKETWEIIAYVIKSLS